MCDCSGRRLAVGAGRPVALFAWARALAPRFTYRASMVATATVVCGKRGVTTRATRNVLLAVTADTATGRAVRTYRRETRTTVSTPSETVRVTGTCR